LYRLSSVLVFFGLIALSVTGATPSDSNVMTSDSVSVPQGVISEEVHISTVIDADGINLVSADSTEQGGTR